MMYQKLITHLSILVVLFGMVTIGLAQVVANNEIEQMRSVRTGPEAITLANNLTGFTGLYKNRTTASSAVSVVAKAFVDSTTPFIHKSLNNKPAWKVTYSNMDLTLDTTKRTSSTNNLRTCEIWIDSLSGRLLRAEIYRLDRPSVGYRMPTPEEAERQLWGVREKYYGLPDIPPSFDLLEALRKNQPHPLFAKEVYVQYIMYSRQGSSPVPAWVIYKRGTKPMRFPGVDKHPEHLGSNWRIVYDAITGQAFPESNTPFPILTSDGE